MGGKYTKIKEIAWQVEHARVVWNDPEGHSRRFENIREGSGTIQSVTESLRTFWKFLHGSTNIHMPYINHSPSILESVWWRQQSSEERKVTYLWTVWLIKWVLVHTQEVLFSDYTTQHVTTCLMCVGTMCRIVYLSKQHCVKVSISLMQWWLVGLWLFNGRAQLGKLKLRMGLSKIMYFVLN
jgi:hypothetical protein